MIRGRKKAILITGILLALPVLFLVEEHVRGKWVLAKYKRQLAARGEKLTIEACRPPFPDPADNGYGAFMQAMASVPSQLIAEAAPQPMRAVAPGRVRGLQGLAEWPMTGAALRNPATNSNWQMLEELLEGSRDSLEAARLALLKPAFESHVPYSLLQFQLPGHLTTTRRASQCWNANALLQLHHGRLTNALEQLEAGLRLCQALREERIIISQFIRFSTISFAFGPTWQALQTPGWNDAQLARLQQAWRTNDFLTPLLQAMEMDRAMYVDMYEQTRGSAERAAKLAALMDSGMFSGPSGSGGVSSFEDLTQNLGEAGGKLLKRGLFIPVWQFAWSFEDERHYLEATQTILEGARDAVAQQSLRPSTESGRKLESRSKDESFYDRMRHFASPSVNFSQHLYLSRAAVAQAMRDLAIVGIALKRHELRHGKLPPDLNALVPEFLPAVPADFFDGQPLRYRVSEGGGFLLYSIGRDEKDDGGDPNPPEKTGTVFFTNGRDLVWPQPAAAVEILEFEKLQKQKAESKGPRRSNSR